MSDVPDAVLLAEFARNRSEAAFGEMVQRHVALVHSVARRHTANAQQAEDITQAVFTILARKAGALGRRTVLPGWLYHTARLTAANYRRAEMRRVRREQEAYMQSTLDEPANDTLWQELSPQLDEAMACLGASERDALVLRYFQNKSVAEVGMHLGVGENTAQKRVGRGLEKLRRYFGQRGIVSTTAILGAEISAHSVQAVPAALASSMTAVVLAKGAAASGSTLTLVKGALKIMTWTKAKTAVLAAGILLVAGTGTVVIKSHYLPGEPSYQGRRLSEWLVDVDHTQPPEKKRVAGEAIRKMGTKTLPFLLADLGDEHFKRIHYRMPDTRTPDERSRQATWAFDALGPAAKSAIPELQKLLEKNPGYVPSALAGIGSDALPELLAALTNEDFFVRDNTAAAIANAIFSEKINPAEASAAFPIAISNLTYANTNELFQVNTRSRAAWLVAALKQSPEISVPALIGGLQDSNATVASDCAFALSQFRKDAKPAIPELKKAADSTNNLIRTMAKQSLEQIQNAQ